jgi:hypothetical protein
VDDFTDAVRRVADGGTVLDVAFLEVPVLVSRRSGARDPRARGRDLSL